VAACLEQRLGGDDCTVQIQPVLLQNKVLLPQVDEVGLQGITRRPIIVEASVVSLKSGSKSVYFRPLREEEPTLRD
jgi:hypothetical protein